MSDNETTLYQALGIDEASEEEQEKFMTEVGLLILDAALSRFFLSLEESELNNLKAEIEKRDEIEDVMNFLFENYSDFQTILEEEANNFRDEAMAVIS